MDDINDETYAAPVVQGFTPINKVAKTLPKKRSSRLDTEATSSEPPKKQRKKAPASKPPAAPITTRSRKASTKDVKPAKSKPLSKTKVAAPKQSPTTRNPTPNLEPLSTAKASKLNASRLKNTSLPATSVKSSVKPQGKPSTKSSRRQETDKIPLAEHEKSDDTLSSDPWKDQDPLLNYPWLYAVYPKENIPVEPVANLEPADRSMLSNDDQFDDSTLLAQFFPPNNHTQTVQTDDSLMHDSELEELLDYLEEKPDDLKNKTASSPVQELPQANGIAKEDNVLEADDFIIDEDDLDILLEATSSVKSCDSPAKSGSTSGFAGNTIEQQQPKGISSRNDRALVTKPAVTQDLDEKNFDLDIDDFEDMIGLLEALPDNPVPESIKSPVYQTPSPSKNALTASQMITPQSTTTGSSPRTGEASGDIHSRFVRPLHPAALQTPSPIPGLSPTKRVLTCFRIGEVINATAKAQRQGSKVFIELFARVLHSTRTGSVQTFRIVDLWSSPDRVGTVLEGKWVGWEKADLWRKDGDVFWRDALQNPATAAESPKTSYARKCRLVGSLGRKADGEYLLDILNLWEAAWDDIAFAKGLIFGLQGKISTAA